MKTLKLTAKDFRETDSYYKEYCGKEDVSNYDGHIEIEGNLSYVFFHTLSATGHIWAEAGTGIEAGEGIEAGTGIKAGWGIKAGEGIEAGLTISCKLTLNIAYRIFAGLATWKKEISKEESSIICGKLENGTVCYGTLIETGLPNQNEDKKKELIEKANELIAKAKEMRETADKL